MTSLDLSPFFENVASHGLLPYNYIVKKNSWVFSEAQSSVKLFSQNKINNRESEVTGES
jgi:hypothetical protein